MLNKFKEPMFVPVCPNCFGYIRHGFRVGTWECESCGFVIEDDLETINKSF